MNVYLDNAATTHIKPSVLNEMLPYFKEQYGNPSSMHKIGFKTKKMINESRQTIAKLLDCSKEEIHFTSGGTEATNWALKGLAFANKTKGEIITTPIEHHATLHTANFLETLGYVIHYVNVSPEGFVDLEHLKELINPNTLVVSVILANNEIGTIQYIDKIQAICDQMRVYLHVDAVQAVTHIPLSLHDMKCDLLSLSGHKFHAPKGIGILYIKNGVKIENLIHGGQQENGKRSGTENVPYIKGITKALQLGIQAINEYKPTLDKLSKHFLNRLDEYNIPYKLNGPLIGNHRLPGNLNISFFSDIDATTIMYYLNKANIYVSSGSACDSSNIEPSHVLEAIQVPLDIIQNTIRFSIGVDITKKELDYVADTINNILQKKSD